MFVLPVWLMLIRGCFCRPCVGNHHFFVKLEYEVILVTRVESSSCCHQFVASTTVVNNFCGPVLLTVEKRG